MIFPGEDLFTLLKYSFVIFHAHLERRRSFNRQQHSYKCKQVILNLLEVIQPLIKCQPSPTKAITEIAMIFVKHADKKARKETLHIPKELTLLLVKMGVPKLKCPGRMNGLYNKKTAKERQWIYAENKTPFFRPSMLKEFITHATWQEIASSHLW